MDQEKLKILKMVEEKKISAEEAATLLEALEGCQGKPEQPHAAQKDIRNRVIKIKVSDLDSGRVRVNLCLPVTIAHIITSLIPDQELERMEEHGINVNSIMKAIESDATGKVFDVEDEMNRAHVEISIE